MVTWTLYSEVWGDWRLRRERSSQRRNEVNGAERRFRRSLQFHSGGSTSIVPGGGGGGASFLNTATRSRPPSMPKIVPMNTLKSMLGAVLNGRRPAASAPEVVS